jgi:NTP pyrophosphatase (non-canonical NTP hydrolase)
MRAMDDILDLVHRECNRQERKWGVQTHDDNKWMVILTEEVGEAAMDINELGDGSLTPEVREELINRLRSELAQVAAVAVSWLDCIERRQEEKEENEKL